MVVLLTIEARESSKRPGLTSASGTETMSSAFLSGTDKRLGRIKTGYLVGEQTNLFLAAVARAVVAGVIVTGMNFPSTAWSEDQPAHSALVESALEPWTGTLDAMVDRGTIRVLVPQCPTHFFMDNNGNLDGLTHGLLTRFEEYVNNRVDNRLDFVNIQYIPVALGDRVEALRSGRGDLVAGDLSIDDAVSDRAAVSRPFRSNVKLIVVTHSAGPEFSTLSDLSGETIHAPESGEAHESLKDLSDTFIRRGDDGIDIRTVDKDLGAIGLLKLLNDGVVAATVADGDQARVLRSALPHIHPRSDLILRSGIVKAWAIRKDDPQLLDLVDGFLADHREGTLAGNVLIDRYLGKGRDIKDIPLTNADERFAKLRRLFETHGHAYGIDPLVLTAIAYQESNFEDGARGPAGARGLMQMRPSTARSDVVDISQLTQPENSVEAAAKYLRHLLDSRFSQPGVGDLDRTLLAVAAYNAGPHQIAALQEKADAMGLDPHVWFHNVEVAAAEAGIHTTVRYVREVQTYAVAFRLLAERRAAAREARSAFRP